MLLDIHTHNMTQDAVVSVKSFSGSFETIPNNIFFSAGLHPWFLQKETAVEQLSELESLMFNENMIAVGECGLEKACATDFDLQKQIFAAQIEFAKKYQKPLIIHCVRAFDEVMQLLEQKEFNQPVIFHGFNKSIELAKRIIAKNYFLSFGKDLLKPRLAQVFQSLPADCFLLETDDADMSIEEIYSTASELRNQTFYELEKQVMQNAKSVFQNNSFFLGNQSR